MRIMHKSVLEKYKPIIEDNFEWQVQVSHQMRQWYQRENFSIEDAFRVIDRNYNGEVNKDDLRRFLIEILRIKEEEVTQGRLNRLFKLMD